MEQTHQLPTSLRHEILHMGGAKSCQIDKVMRQYDNATLGSVERRALHCPCATCRPEVAALYKRYVSCSLSIPGMPSTI